MPNEGHIIVKKGASRKIQGFFTPVDKGSSKPAFCYPAKIQEYRENVKAMKRNLEQGYIATDQRMSYEMKYNQRAQRLSELENSEANAKSIIAKDPDYWNKRHKELKEEIRNAMPSRSDYKGKRVNPHTIVKNEKEGLGRMKREYQIISKALGEDSNITFLERD